MPLRPHQIDALDAMAKNPKGQVIVPTGGGKTMCMIEDAKRVFRTQEVSTIVVVAPRILLAEQLCSEFLETGEFNEVRVMLCLTTVNMHNSNIVELSCFQELRT